MNLKKLLDKGYKGVTVKTALWAGLGAASGYIAPRCGAWLGKKMFKVEEYERDTSVDKTAASTVALTCALANYYDNTHDLNLRKKVVLYWCALGVSDLFSCCEMRKVY